MIASDLIVWLNALIVLFSIVSLLTAIGVVWKAEKMLDIAFKLFLAAIVAHIFSEVFRYFSVDEGSFMMVLEAISRFFFAMLFLFGMLSIRRMMKRVEKQMQETERVGEE